MRELDNSCQGTPPSAARRTDGFRPWDRCVGSFLAATAILIVLSTSWFYLKFHASPIRGDGFGYYAYLPAIFIDHDVSMNTLGERQFRGPIPRVLGIKPYLDTGKYLDKYPIGVAVLVAPFFALADGYTALAGTPQMRTGFSTPYQVASVLAGGVYACAGLYLLALALRRHFDRISTVGALVLVTYGTNVFHYATYDSSMSHVFSFFLASAWLAILLRSVDEDAPAARLAALGVVVLSLAAFVRPTNVLFGLLLPPFLLAKWRAGDLIKPASAIGAGVGILAGAVPLAFLQTSYWSSISGTRILYSYQSERFNWLDPELSNFLFSINKGLFVWEPLVAVAIAGLLALPPAIRSLRPWILALVIGEIYVCACWSTWSFGGGFGCRPFVEMMPVLALPLAAVIAWARGRSRVVRASLGMLAATWIAVNCLLMTALWSQDIPYSDPTWADVNGVWRNYRAILLRYEPTRELPKSVRLSLRSLSQAGDRVAFVVDVANDGKEVLRPYGRYPVRLSWRFVRADQPEPPKDQGWRTRRKIPEDIPAGASLTVDVAADPPTDPGDYWLEISLVAESRYWFHEQGMPILRAPEPLHFGK